MSSLGGFEKTSLQTRSPTSPDGGLPQGLSEAPPAAAKAGANEAGADGMMAAQAGAGSGTGAEAGAGSVAVEADVGVMTAAEAGAGSSVAAEAGAGSVAVEEGVGGTVAAEAAAGCDMAAGALSGPQAERGTAWEPVVGDEIPPNAGGGDHGLTVARARQGVAGPHPEGPEAPVAPDHGPGGAKAQESRGAETPAADPKAEVERAEDGATLSACGAGEEGGEKAEEGGEKAEEGGEKPEEGGEKAEEGGEKPEESDGGRGAEQAGPGPPNVALQMRSLEAIQVDLNTVNAQAERALQQLEHKFGQIRQYYLERRNYVIQSIPGFWVTALRNHPQLFEMITGRDAEMLRYITNLEVKESRLHRASCRFKFFFRRNPFFRNTLIVKDYEVRPTGQVISLSTPIIWRPGYEPQPFIHGNRDTMCSFFTWLSDHSHPERDRIAQIIKEELWPNPLQYYPLHAGAARARRHQIEPVEIPRPFGFQSG